MSLARQLAYVELNGWGFGAAPRGQKAGLIQGPRCISGARQPKEQERGSRLCSHTRAAPGTHWPGVVAVLRLQSFVGNGSLTWRLQSASFSRTRITPWILIKTIRKYTIPFLHPRGGWNKRGRRKKTNFTGMGLQYGYSHTWIFFFFLLWSWPFSHSITLLELLKWFHASWFSLISQMSTVR